MWGHIAWIDQILEFEDSSECRKAHENSVFDLIVRGQISQNLPRESRGKQFHMSNHGEISLTKQAVRILCLNAGRGANSWSITARVINDFA